MKDQDFERLEDTLGRIYNWAQKIDGKNQREDVELSRCIMLEAALNLAKVREMRRENERRESGISRLEKRADLVRGLDL